MLRFLVRRLLYAVPILLGVTLLTFVTFYVVVPPEQVARRNISSKDPTREEIRDWLEAHGYDRPLPQQFTRHVGELLLFRFGKSDADEQPVWKKVRDGAGPSLMVAVPTFLAGAFAAICLALLLASYRATYLDYWGVALCVLLMSVNYVLWFVAGQHLLSRLLRIAPLAGFDRGWEGLKFVVLPALVGVVASLGANTRLYRAAILEEAGQDYVRTARARGVPERRILFRHILKNAASPILTALVLNIPSLFLGSLLLESFFGIPGLGSTTVDAINSADFAVVRAMVFLGTLAYVVGNILTDVSYALVDPRVRLE